jgi:phage-related minor tail protein
MSERKALTAEHLAIMALKDTPSDVSGVEALTAEQTRLLHEAYDLVDAASEQRP